MKKAITWTVLLIFLIAVIPITAGIKQDTKDEIKTYAEKRKQTSVELSTEEIDYIISNIMEYITEDFSTECKKAVVTLCKNNAIVQKSEGLQLKKTEVSKYSDSFYDELKKYLAEDNSAISLDGNRVFIPITKLCPGYIVESSDYPYISTVACPWDLQNSEYIKGFEYPCGISINGLESLCLSGVDSKYALSYFLPQFHIN